MVFKRAKLCVCVCVCMYICRAARKQYSGNTCRRFPLTPDQRCPVHFPDDDDALTCLGRNIDTFHSIESFFLFLLSVSILREKKTKQKRQGMPKIPLSKEKAE